MHPLKECKIIFVCVSFNRSKAKTNVTFVSIIKFKGRWVGVSSQFDFGLLHCQRGLILFTVLDESHAVKLHDGFFTVITHLVMLFGFFWIIFLVWDVSRLLWSELKCCWPMKCTTVSCHFEWHDVNLFLASNSVFTILCFAVLIGLSGTSHSRQFAWIALSL